MTFAYLAANSTSTINDVEPGLLGFLVVAVLGLALVFLLRSMNKQFKKIGPKPEDPEGIEAEGASEAVRQRPLRRFSWAPCKGGFPAPSCMQRRVERRSPGPPSWVRSPCWCSDWEPCRRFLR